MARLPYAFWLLALLHWIHNYARVPRVPEVQEPATPAEMSACLAAYDYNDYDEHNVYGNNAEGEKNGIYTDFYENEIDKNLIIALAEDADEEDFIYENTVDFENAADYVNNAQSEHFALMAKSIKAAQQGKLKVSGVDENIDKKIPEDAIIVERNSTIIKGKYKTGETPYTLRFKRRPRGRLVPWGSKAIYLNDGCIRWREHGPRKAAPESS